MAVYLSFVLKNAAREHVDPAVRERVSIGQCNHGRRDWGSIDADALVFVEGHDPCSTEDVAAEIADFFCHRNRYKPVAVRFNKSDWFVGALGRD